MLKGEGSGPARWQDADQTKQNHLIIEAEYAENQRK